MMTNREIEDQAHRKRTKTLLMSQLFWTGSWTSCARHNTRHFKDRRLTNYQKRFREKEISRTLRCSRANHGISTTACFSCGLKYKKKNFPNLFLKTIIMRDENRCFVYDSETKRKSAQWVGEIRRGQKNCGINTELIFFFWFLRECIIYIYVSEKYGQFWNLYKNVSDRPCSRIARVGSALWKNSFFFLLHDNTPESIDCLLIFGQKTSSCTSPSLEFIRFESSGIFSVSRI